MNDLHALLSLQHRGLRTFKIFQQKLETLSRDKPEHRALCRLLVALSVATSKLLTRNLCLSRSRIAPIIAWLGRKPRFSN